MNRAQPTLSRRLLPLAILSLLCVTSQDSWSQVRTDASATLIDHYLMAAVIGARQDAIANQLQRLSLEIGDATVSVPRSAAVATDTTRLAPRGQAGHPLWTSHGFFSLPSPWTDRRDDMGYGLAYCVFDDRTDNSLTASAPGRHVTTGNVAFALLAPGINGRFDNTCNDLRETSNNGLRPASKKKSGDVDDDVVVLVTFDLLRLSGRTNRQAGPAVKTLAQLQAMATLGEVGTGRVMDGQIRLVTDLNQLFVARVQDDNTISWQALTPGSRVRSNAPDSGLRWDVAWLSGVMSIGNDRAVEVPGPDPATPVGNPAPRAALTLGNRQRTDTGSWETNRNVSTGLTLRDAQGVVRSYVGLAGSANDTLVIRHTDTRNAADSTRDKLRITADGRLWLGDVPAQATSPDTTVRISLHGATQVLTGGGLTAVAADYLRIASAAGVATDNVQTSAGLRYFTSDTGPHGLEIRLLQDSEDANTRLRNTVTGSGDIRIVTNGGVAMAYPVPTTPLYTLDVNGGLVAQGNVVIDNTVTAAAGSNSALTIVTEQGKAADLWFKPDGKLNAWKIRAEHDAASATRIFMTAIGGRTGLSSTPVQFVHSNGGTTLTVDALLKANGPVQVISDTGMKQTLLTVNGESNINSPTRLTGNLTVSGGITALQSLRAATATFNAAISAQGGLTVGGDALTAKQGLEVNGKPLKTSGGLTATTAIFTNGLTAGQGLVVAGGPLQTRDLQVSGAALLARQGIGVGQDVNLADNLRVTGDMLIDGKLTLNRGLRGGSDLTLLFYGFTTANETTGAVRLIGSTTFGANTSSQSIYLDHANPLLHAVDQSISTQSSPSFQGLTIDGDVVSSGQVSTLDRLIGPLQGTAEQADRLNKTLRLDVIQREGGPITQSRIIDLSTPGDHTVDLILNAVMRYSNALNKPVFNSKQDSDQRKAKITISQYKPNVTVTCDRIAPAGAEDPGNCEFRDPPFLFLTLKATEPVLKSNTYLMGKGLELGRVTVNRVEQPVSVERAEVTAAPLPLAAELNIVSNFGITESTVSLDPMGGPTTLVFKAKDLTRARVMDQDLKRDSAVRFKNIDIGAGGARYAGLLDAGAQLQAAHSAKMTRLTLEHNGLVPIDLKGDSTQVDIGGPGNQNKISLQNILSANSTVQASRLHGTARRTDQLTKPLALELNAPLLLEITPDSNVPKTFTIKATLKDNSLNGVLLKNGAVTASQLVAQSVTADKIADGQILGAHLADQTVTTSKIDLGAIDAEHISNQAVGTKALANNAIRTRHIQDESVGTQQLADGAVTRQKLNQNLQNSLAISSSDIRLKTDITSVSGPDLIERLSRLRAYHYTLVDDPLQTPRIGVLAQEIQALFPELVLDQTEGPHQGFLAVNYAALGAVAAAGVAELKRQLDWLGLQPIGVDTLRVTTPVLSVRQISAQTAIIKQLEADSVNATQAKVKQVDTKQLESTQARGRHTQVVVANSGSLEGLAGDAGLSLLTQPGDGHYWIQISSVDGSHAAASVQVSQGNIQVFPIAAQGIQIHATPGRVSVTASGRWIRASWLKTA